MDGSAMSDTQRMSQSIRMRLSRRSDCFAQCLAQKIIARQWLDRDEGIAV